MDKKKILIVEDDKDFLYILCQVFKNDFFYVFSASDGEEGLSVAKKENPDLIIIDILLPKMDGIQMAQKIKESGINSKIIFLTNFTDPDHISKAIQIDSQADYIVKSDVRIESIVERVKNKLGVK